jgi:hypothetical protein
MQFAGTKAAANIRCCFGRSVETTVKQADSMDKLMDRKVFNARDAH